MNRNWRTALYAAAGAALVIAMLAAPGAWATPGQSTRNQTVPMPTPSPTPVTPEPPASPEPPVSPEPPPPTTDPGGQSTAAPGATAAPGPTAAATATRAPAQPRSPLTLTLVADREQVWPGARVTFTLTVTNAGRTALQQVSVEDVLAQGLEPGDVLSGEATWDGTTLRATAPTLPAGAELVLVYTARVTATAPGQAIITRATATAAGGARATASLTLGLPPSELPATGGCVAP